MKIVCQCKSRKPYDRPCGGIDEQGWRQRRRMSSPRERAPFKRGTGEAGLGVGGTGRTTLTQ